VRREPGERGENGRRRPGSQLGHRYQTRGNGPTGPGRPFLAHIKHALFMLPEGDKLTTFQPTEVHLNDIFLFPQPTHDY
jgi:hypothetical protein